jgi:hypothetical protein
MAGAHNYSAQSSSSLLSLFNPSVDFVVAHAFRPKMLAQRSVRSTTGTFERRPILALAWLPVYWLLLACKSLMLLFGVFAAMAASAADGSVPAALVHKLFVIRTAAFKASPLLCQVEVATRCHPTSLSGTLRGQNLLLVASIELQAVERLVRIDPFASKCFGS